MSRARPLAKPGQAKALLAGVLFWLGFAALLWLGLQNALAAGALYPGASLRFARPVSAAQADAARQYTIQKQLEYWPSFWSEETLEAQSELRSAEMRALRYSGEAGAVYPASYLRGGSPGFTDAGGCALSRQAAWLLWGSEDVLGKELMAGGSRYTVRGVFEGKQALLLLCQGLNTPQNGWDAAELWGARPLGREAALNFAQNAGLGSPSALLQGSALGGLLQATALLPAIFLGGWLLFGLLGALHPLRSGRGQLLFFLLLLALALALPFLLRQLPEALLPTRWSYFGYWARLFGQAGDALWQFWAMAPSLRDVQLKQRLLQQGLLLLLATPYAFYLGRYNRAFTR